MFHIVRARLIKPWMTTCLSAQPRNTFPETFTRSLHTLATVLGSDNNEYGNLHVSCFQTETKEVPQGN